MSRLIAQTISRISSTYPRTVIYSRATFATNNDKSQVITKVTEMKDQVMGSIKENLGYVIGNKTMETEGRHQKATSDFEKSKDQVMSTATDARDQTLKRTQENINSASDSATSAKDQVIDKATAAKDQIVDKATAAKDQLVGAVKENVGYTTGNKTLESEGNIQRNIASDKIPMDKQNIAVKTSVAKEHIIGKAKETVGNMSGNDAMMDEGKRRQNNADKVYADKVLQKNASSQKKNP